MAAHQFPGFFLVLEGIDGTGKSTQCDLVAAALQQLGHDVVRTKEPTNGKWGTILRQSATNGRLALEEELRLFMDDRREHVANLIEPALREGKIVICDRYYFSTAAYQGARGADLREVLHANEAFAPEPDLLVILDLDPQASHGRIHARGDTVNEFEQAKALAQVRSLFLAIEKPYLLRLDAGRAPEAIRDQIVATVLERFAARRLRVPASRSNHEMLL